MGRLGELPCGPGQTLGYVECFRTATARLQNHRLASLPFHDVNRPRRAKLLVHDIQKIQGPPPLGYAHRRNRRGFIVGFTKGGEISAAPSVLVSALAAGIEG
jgi:hypothetical protein